MTKKTASSAPRKIRELVAHFDEHRENYRRGDYNEAHVRQDFIDPFFEALGWDMTNRAGSAEAYREVIHEDALRVEKTVKAPDYSFRIGPVRKFFVEAKKPSVDIKEEVGPAFQLRRYAWTAKLPLSILTDFEEFAVYDCRVKPDKDDKASTARVKFLTYTEYVDKWDEIASIFSRESVHKGRFDDFAGSTKKKRGTAEVDEAFLAEIEGWREALAKNLSLRNDSLKDRELNFSVQRIIDRIIFLRMCEGRGIEPYARLQSLANGERAYARLVEMFHRADEKYNSGLFHFQSERGREPPDELTTGLAVDDKVLKEIVKKLYYPDSPYEFAALPADILGQVYEQFLGKVIRLTAGHRAKIEEKPEVRKAGGVYYTPTYIVEYIVQNTVGKLLEGKTPQEVGGLTKTYKSSKTARPLSVLDPACGSGSFLIGAYQHLLDWYLKQYTEVDKPEKHTRGKDARVYQRGKGEWRLTTAERKRILLAHIYGVDIDYQAVEVTKLSLLLKVLEGETEETLGRQLKLLHKDRALPDLAANIKCGNSLIGPDFYAGRQRDLFDEAEMQRINAFDWQQEFAHIFAGKNPGFNAVIGNPPYVRSMNLKSMYPVEWNFYHSHYYTASVREWDIYLVFVEKGLSLTKTSGRLGFILPNKFLNSQVGANLRDLLGQRRALEGLVHFGSYQVFHGVTTYTCLLFLSGSERSTSEVYLIRDERLTGQTDPPLPNNLTNSWERETIKNKTLSSAPWAFGRDSQNIFGKYQDFPKLGDLVQIFQGTGTRADKVFLLKEISVRKNEFLVASSELLNEYKLEGRFLEKAYRGRNIERYRIAPPKYWLLVPYVVETGNLQLVSEQVLKTDAPATYQYLVECKDRLNARENGRFRGSRWFCYGRPQNMEKMLISEKIVFPDVVIRGE